MRFISLFAGIGGFDLGLERAGMKCVGQVEIDEKCLAWLNYRWPYIKKVKDIHNVKGNEFGPVELVCGGFPCQPHSNAGKKLRTRDDRYLWPEMFRVVKSVRPFAVIAENVSAIDDITDMVLDRTITDLESIGYEVGPPLEIPACAVDAPHERKRVFVVAYSKEYIIYREGDAWFGRSGPTDGGRALGDSGGAGLQRKKQRETPGKGAWTPRPVTERDSNVGDTESDLRRASRNGGYHASYWTSSEFIECGDGKTRRIPPVESGICPVANGVPGRVAKLRGYGNAVIPQIAEVIGRAIIDSVFIDKLKTNRRSLYE